MDEQQQSDVIRSVILDTFPDECLHAGKANLDDIVRLRGRVHFAPIDGASKLDLALPLAVLASAAAILAHGFSIAKTWRESRKRDPSPLVVEIKLSLPEDLAKRLEPQALDRMLALFVQRVSDQEAEQPRERIAPPGDTLTP